MVLVFIGFILFVYSLSVQTFRFTKNRLTPKYKKTPQYKAFEKELNSLVYQDSIKETTL